MFENKTLLITGGTGSFGNAVLNRFLHSDHFEEIRIFSRDEKKQDDMRNALKNDKIKRAKELYQEGYKKSEILRMIIKQFKLERNLNSRSWPKWLSNI